MSKKFLFAASEESLCANVKKEFQDLLDNLKPFSADHWVLLKWYEKVIRFIEVISSSSYFYILTGRLTRRLTILLADSILNRFKTDDPFGER